MSKPKITLTALERIALAIAPQWGLNRIRARQAALQLVRTYEASSPSRRSDNWTRQRGDVNVIIHRAGEELRLHAQDLIRNNGYARRAQRVAANHTVGWGVVPKARGEAAKQAQEVWKTWADATTCEAEGRHTFYGLQHLAMKTVFKSGEVLIRRRPRLLSDGLPLPLQLQILDPEFIDSSHHGTQAQAGGPTISGIEFDKLGRRDAYWIFPQHPGSNGQPLVSGNISKRIPASEIAHIFYAEDPNQARGVSWLAAAIVNLKDLDEYEDAEILKQKIASCFAAFVTDMDGMGQRVGDENDTSDDEIDQLGPGMIINLPPGKQVTAANPPTLTSDALPARTLRKVSAGIGITYEDMTGDYSQVNFSSARMGRLAHQANVRDWQGNMLIPLFCDPIWRWAMDAAVLAGKLPKPAAPITAEWTAPPLPMIDPDKEASAMINQVRGGMMTPSGMIREQGGDPEAHFTEYAEDMAMLEAKKIKLDCDVRAVSQAGLTQERAGAAGGPPAANGNEDGKPLSKKALEQLRADLKLPIPT